MKKQIVSLILIALCVLSSLSIFAPTVKAAGPAWLEDYEFRQLYTNSTGTLADSTFLTVPTGYYELSKTGIQYTAVNYASQKVAVINGVRYVLGTSGYSGGASPSYPIAVYQVNELWQPIARLGNMTDKVGDFYVTVAPESTLNEYIIVYGSNATTYDAFITYFDTASNTWGSMVNCNSYAEYITAVNYIAVLDKFQITVCDTHNGAGVSNRTVLSTAANLFTPANWELYGDYASLSGLNERRYTYFTGDNCLYVNTRNSSSNTVVYRENLTSGVITPVYSNSSSIVGNYISSDANYVYFTNPLGTYYYWLKGSGSTWTEFYNAPIIGYSGSSTERHPHVIPLGGNLLMIGNLHDGNSSGYYGLLDMNTLPATILETYSGVLQHCTENKVTVDGSNLLIGAESTYSGAVSSVHLFTSGLLGQSNGGVEVRFTKTDGTTLLNYRTITATAFTATYAINTASSLNGFYMYWGKSGAESLSDVTYNPYLIKDSFNDSSYNTTTWTTIAGTLTETSALKLASTTGASNRAMFRSNAQFNTTIYPLQIDVRMNISSNQFLAVCTNTDGTRETSWYELNNTDKSVFANFASPYPFMKSSYALAGSSYDLSAATVATGVTMSNTYTYNHFNNRGYILSYLTVGSKSAPSVVNPYPFTSGYIGFFIRETVGVFVYIEDVAVYTTPNANTDTGDIETFDDYVESYITLTINAPLSTQYAAGNIPINFTITTDGTDPVATWNILFSNTSWCFGSNQTYTAPTTVSISGNTTAALYVQVTVTEGYTVYEMVPFTTYEEIVVTPTPSPTVEPSQNVGTPTDYFTPIISILVSQSMIILFAIFLIAAVCWVMLGPWGFFIGFNVGAILVYLLGYLDLWVLVVVFLVDILLIYGRVKTGKDTEGGPIQE